VSELGRSYHEGCATERVFWPKTARLPRPPAFGKFPQPARTSAPKPARGDNKLDWGDTWYWLAIGLLGQAAFFLRFLVQWWESERRGESVIPLSFWYLSIFGSAVLLIYAIHRREPVFILAYLPNAFVYARNLALLRRKQREREEPKAEPPAIEPLPSARRS